MLLIKTVDERPSKAGDLYKHGIVKTEDGREVGFMAFRKSFKDYDLIKEGSAVEGLLTPTTDRKSNFLNSPKENPANRNFGANKPMPAAITKAMDRKEESIGKFTDRKEESIRMAGATRDAVLIVTAMMSHPSFTNGFMVEDDIKIAVKDWQKNIYDLSGQPFL